MKYVLPLIMLAIALSGCTGFEQEQGLQQLQEIELRYMGRGTIAPASITEIDLMQRELEALKPKASARVQEMVGIRLGLLEFSRHYLEAEKARERISIAKGGCLETDSLKQTINRLGDALAKEATLKARIESFPKSSPGLYAQSNISLEDFQEFANTIRNLRDEMQAFYEQACSG